VRTSNLLTHQPSAAVSAAVRADGRACAPRLEGDDERDCGDDDADVDEAGMP
jgi:hypothetical protein